MDEHAATLPTRSPSDAVGSRVAPEHATMPAPPPSDGRGVHGGDRVSSPKPPTHTGLPHFSLLVSHPRPARIFPFLSPPSKSRSPLSLSSDLHLAPLSASTLFFGSR
jgi:hypothetical protein